MGFLCSGNGESNRGSQQGGAAHRAWLGHLECHRDTIIFDHFLLVSCKPQELGQAARGPGAHSNTLRLGRWVVRSALHRTFPVARCSFHGVMVHSSLAASSRHCTMWEALHKNSYQRIPIQLFTSACLRGHRSPAFRPHQTACFWSNWTKIYSG